MDNERMEQIAANTVKSPELCGDCGVPFSHGRSRVAVCLTCFLRDKDDQTAEETWSESDMKAPDDLDELAFAVRGFLRELGISNSPSVADEDRWPGLSDLLDALPAE